MNRKVLVLIVVGVFLFSISISAKEVFAPSHPEYVGFDSPRKQVSQGIEPEAVVCNKELVLIVKLNGSPACVKPKTAETLEKRDWGFIPPPYSKKIHEPSENVDTPQTQIQSPKLECSGTARCFTGTVTQVIDGDTIKVDGKSIRFSLASAPELHEFEGDEAKWLIDTICPTGSTALVDEDDGQTEGSYGRIIAVIYCNDLNLNEELLDSSLGYLSSGFCSRSEFASSSWAQKHGCTSSYEPKTSSPPTEIKEDCDPSYPDFCIPSPPPDLDCGDIPQKRFTVLQPDPHRFDGDKDGIGCES